MRVLQRIGTLAAAAASGAGVFWLPGMLGRGLTGSPAPGLLLVSFLGPLAVRWTCLRLARRFARRSGAAWIAEGMLAGMWLLGPIFMFSAACMAGHIGPHRALLELAELYAYLPLVPLVTLILSGADGSLAGLLAASCVLAYSSAELRPDDGSCGFPGEPALGYAAWTCALPPGPGRCMVCATGLEAGQSVHRCPTCDTALHVDCHVYLGGCGRFGCPESASVAQPPCTRLA